MSAQRLAMEFVLLDGGSAVAKHLGASLRTLGEEGKNAAGHIDKMVDRFNAGLKLLGTSRALKESLLEPGIEAAGSLEAALKGLEVNLDRGSIQETKATLAELGKDAARIAGPTKFSQEDMVGVQTELLKAGLRKEDVAGKGGAAEAVANLATSEKNMTAEMATEAVLAIGGAFQLAGDQFARSTDLMSRASGASNIGPMEIKESLKMISGASRLDQREVLGALGAMAQQNLGQGSQAGSSLNNFLLQAAKNDTKMKLGLFDKEGSLKSLPEVAEQLRKKFGDMSNKDRSKALNKAFGEEGMRAAEALMTTGTGSLTDILEKMENGRGLNEKVDIMSTGYRAQLDALGGTVQTTLSTLFTPALAPLGAAARKLNDAASWVNDAATEHNSLASAASFGAMGAVALTGGLGVAKMAQGGASGLGALGSIGKLGGLTKVLAGLGGTAAGVAEGKALEAAVGVTPVFVTNWPATMGGGGPSAGDSIVKLAAAAGGMSAAAIGIGVTLATLGGLATGTAINEGVIKGTNMQDAIEGYLAQGALTFGGLFMGKEDKQGVQRVRDRGIEAMQEMLGLKVDVHIDNEGNASVEAKFDDGTRAAARSGAP